MAKKKKTLQTTTIFRALGVAVVIGAVALLGWLAWQWQANLRVEEIDLAGHERAARDTLLALARVDTGAVLFALDPDFVADRLRRHPWVRTAEATRLPTGTLRLRVEERQPAALALDLSGAPAYYLDAEGFQMPLDSGAVYDVPLISGLDAPYQPVRPVQHEAARALLAALADEALLREGAARVSEIAFADGEAWLYTAPTGTRAAVPVRLGAEDFGPKLKTLRAFWQQAVRAHPQKTFDLIDLRFQGQVVTREAAL